MSTYTNKKNILVAALVVFVLILSVLPLLSYAQQEFIPLEPIPGIEEAYKANDTTLFFNTIFRIGVGIAAGLAVIVLMLGGFEYLTSDVPGRKSDGIERMWGGQC